MLGLTEIRQKKAPSLKYIVIALAILGAGLSYFALPKIWISDFTYVIDENTPNEIRFFAKKVYYETSDHTVRGKDARVELSSKIKLTGTDFKFDQSDEKFELSGNVTISFADGFKLRTQTLKYWHKENLVTVPDDTKITGGRLFKSSETTAFSAMGLDLNTQTSKLRLHSNVAFELRAKRGKKKKKGQIHIGHVKIQSDRSLIDRKKKLVEFSMNPELKLKDRFVRVSFTSLELKGRAAAIQGPNSDQNETRLVIKKDIEIKEPLSGQEFKGTCQLVEIAANLGTVSLKNYPQIYLGENLFTGEEIILNRFENTLEVKNSNGLLTSMEMLKSIRDPAQE